MKKITKEELPEFLTYDVIENLVEMALEFPKTTFNWAEISEILEERGQLMFILEIVSERQKRIDKAMVDAKNCEQKLQEKEKWEIFIKNADPKDFYGNMGEPETPQQYKNKYGRYPSGYDDKGNKL